LSRKCVTHLAASSRYEVKSWP